MGKCQYCGKDTGMFRTVHKDCENKHETGKNQIIDLAEKAAITQTNLPLFQTELDKIAQSSFINNAELKNLLINGWERAVLKALEDDILSQNEENELINYKDHFSFSDKELDQNETYSNMVMAVTIREVLEGKIPNRIHISGIMPFNLQKGETLIWLFQNVPYYEPRSKTTYTGTSKGVSLRIAKGVYYRAGGFKGNPIVTTQTVHIDTGYLAFTDKNIYFTGPVKSFRVRYDKIITFTPYSDGIGMQRDGASSKPMTFLTGNGWLTYNLVINLAHLTQAKLP